MTTLRSLRWSLVLWSATVAAEAASVGLSWGLEPRYDTVLYALQSIAAASAGLLILSRHRHHPIGWLFLGGGLWNAIAADAFQGWGERAAEQGWPGGPFCEWVAALSWVPSGLGWALTFLLFPSGRFTSVRWRAVAWACGAAALSTTVGSSMSSSLGTQFVSGRNPFLVNAPVIEFIRNLGMAAFLVTFGLSAVSLFIRLKRSEGMARQQLKWFALFASCAGILLPLTAVFWNEAPAVRPLAAVTLTLLPIGAGIGIVRHRLYDVDLIISRTVLYGALTALLAGTYAATALLLGVVAGQGSNWATAGATLAAGGLFLPLRNWLQRRVDRRFRSRWYAAMSRMRQFLEDLRAGVASPEDVQSVLQEALGNRTLSLHYVLPATGIVVGAHGEPISDTARPELQRTPIFRNGHMLGEVTWLPAADDQPALLPAVLGAGVLAIEIGRLRVELSRQLDEAKASRARIVAATENERRRIERDLHDGAQQRMVSIGLALRHAQHVLRENAVAEAIQALDGAVGEIAIAIDELRELALGIRPTCLDEGLEPALLDLASRSALPVTVRASGQRFEPDLETVAYFVACEGLTNAIKHSYATEVTVDVERREGSLAISIADDGIGGAAPERGTGLVGLFDRVAACGGALRIDSLPGSGTRLTAEFPCAS